MRKGAWKEAIEREQITARVRRDAVDVLIELNTKLRLSTGKRHEVSPGKIIETLLLKEDARAYVLKELG